MRRIRATLAASAPVLLLFYAALLRFDALVTKYGLIQGPPRVEAPERSLLALGQHLRSRHLRWSFVGQRHGDPVSYLKFARLKNGFYEANVREPVFLSTIQFFLWLTGGQDISVSCASALYSTLLVPAVYLVGSFMSSPTVGLGAGFLLAIEASAINYGVDGWRDDAFAFFMLMTAYWLLRMRRRPSLTNASFAGVFAGATCLTRLTSPSFVVPALAYLVLDGKRETWRKRAIAATLAFLVCAALVAPFLVNNAIAFKDPFYSFDFATELYRGRGSLPVDRPLASLVSLAERVRSHPLAEFDSLLRGLTTYPFGNKWQGLYYVSPRFVALLRIAAFVGLLLLLASGDGRLLLVVLFTALVPFALIWRAPGAALWRLTFFAYPFYLLAAVHSVRIVSSLAFAGVRHRLTDTLRRHPGRATAAGLTAIAGVIAVALVPRCWQYLLVREAALTDGAYSIVAGAGDGWFFGDGWYPAVSAGNVTGRYSHGPNATVFVPSFDPQASVVTLRMQACSPDAWPARRVRVSINGSEVGVLRVVWDAQRAGAYEIRVPQSTLRRGWNRLDLAADGSSVMAAGDTRFLGLEPGQDTAFFLWYVRVSASRDGAAPVDPTARAD